MVDVPYSPFDPGSAGEPAETLVAVRGGGFMMFEGSVTLRIVGSVIELVGGAIE